ncbi:MAG TPA: NADPH:quinone oxidoreductase family protein, partial [Streptosporangiaceae bacterium]
GRILIIGFASGQIPSAALNHALIKNYSIVGLHWGLYQAKDPQAIKDCHAQLTKLAADGVIRPLIGSRLGLDEVAAGVQQLADGEVVGRLVFAPA